eukprot:TRINITY_DN8242_c0_g1_i1.p1 TRINITY_DN8242_c0_g1~~TRINITY_DN8242_c0_g1_i1.p1  ORF type:complete len:468 (-),score=80.18 TRINITY_DN8242_c0_g1_i1:1034-2437(-)
MTEAEEDLSHAVPVADADDEAADRASLDFQSTPSPPVWTRLRVIFVVILVCVGFAAGAGLGIAVYAATRGGYSPSPIPTEPTEPNTDLDLPPTLILVSSDAFRWDYPGLIPLPTIDRLVQTGVSAESMQPSFPSKTFPNHYSIVTGLYPARHGIIDNTMYDPLFNAWFHINDAAAVTDARWWWGEPMWVTCELQGVPSGTYFWPGSEAAIMGVRPSYWAKYNGGVSYENRVDTILSWLDLPQRQRPRFITLYFEAVDNAGHSYGPASPQVLTAMQTVDAAMGRLIAGVESRRMRNSTNIIFLADHGMAELSPDRRIYLEDYITLSDVMVVTYSPVMLLRPAAGKAQQVYDALVNANEHMSVWWNTTVPERFHYTDDRRIAPIVGLAEMGWTITTRGFHETLQGNHGFDNEAKDMHAVFIANGPAFKNDGSKVPTFSNTNVYSLMAHILGVTPAPNDGSLDPVRGLLR